MENVGGTQDPQLAQVSQQYILLRFLRIVEPQGYPFRLTLEREASNPQVRVGALGSVMIQRQSDPNDSPRRKKYIEQIQETGVAIVKCRK